MPKPPSAPAAQADPYTREHRGRASRGGEAARRTGGPHVLLTLGDERTAQLLRTTLRLAGYRVVPARNGAEARLRLTERRFDLVVLDVTLPDLHRLGGARGSLAEPARPPVLLLAGGEFLGSMRSGAGHGPVQTEEILATAERLVRAAEPASGPVPALRYDDLVLDEASCRARRGRRPIPLTPGEYRLLRCLLLHAEQVLSKEQIGRHVWSDLPTVGAVERLVSRLRRKVDEEGDTLIHTRRGFGYWLGRHARF
ncbi:putative two-component system response regulator [Streptomyces ambofaciens ATCC 23877]|uniref:Putative two-component system response regulator n=1 Tax=Streptomyces ambofaciens (strain ATCC 23877 / 3486 / DSM 40053 / JCM 4204 / NBRC 12836 / NRRL B-2516) TaxID=278992 RepID=A0AD33_STRA7|nr:response regulator transcription factor [Streptomyces ambofaciens]AKZ59947.1 putative two-component system response regulator [Streptomyces ambofaciens ATCC 23877]CAJ88388.1 putative two-component system response regulator [Streptomyces ambofaciens ATCC 23877]